MSPIPTRTKQRYEFYRNHKCGDQLRHKRTGKFFILGKMRNVREAWVMQINPPRRGSLSWDVLLNDFEKVSER